jgi:ABC-type transport system substrate-binding protein
MPGRYTGPFIEKFPALEKYINTTALTAYGELGVFDLREAENRLDALGFVDTDGDGIRETPNGTKLSFEFTTSGDPGEWYNNLLFEWAKEALKVGIEIIMDIVPGPISSERYWSSDFDFIMSFYWGPFFDFDVLTAWWRYHPTVVVPPPELMSTFGHVGRWTNDRLTEIYDEVEGMKPDEPAALTLYHEMFDIYMRECPELPLYQGSGQVMFSTAYWEGYPTEENYYVEPSGRMVYLIYHRIHKGSVGLEISFAKSLEGITGALEETLVVLDQQSTTIDGLEDKITSLEGALAASTTNVNMAIGIAAIAIVLAIVLPFVIKR